MSASRPWPRSSGTLNRGPASLTWWLARASWDGQRGAIRVVEDQGISASVTGQRDGFESLVAEVALGQVGIILALEASRLARDNAAWYRLLDLAGVCDTLVGDADAVYHPALFGDRLLLGLMGIMSEAELHVLRARLTGGIRNKAARGELRRGLPAGLIWGEAPGEIIFHPDEAVTGVIAAVFGQFAVRGSARAVWLWLREQNLRWPLQQATTVSRGLPEITWVEPTYKAVLAALRHPAYAGAYVYGRTRAERYVDEHGRLRTRRRDLPSDQWEVLIPGHHDGFIDWDTYQDIQRRLDGNIPPAKGAPGTGAVREGSAHLQTLATCGICGRKAAVYYDGEHKATPGYYCTGGTPGASRGHWHMRVGGAAIDAAVTGAFLAALAPAALQACLAAAGQLEAGYDTALDQHRRQVEQARYQAARAERRYRAVDPENRLVARGLEAEWEHALQAQSDAEAELTRREKARPATLTATDGPRSWPSATTWARCGTPRPPPTRTASSCCAPCSTKSPSPCTATRPKAAPTCCCGGKAARSPNSPCRSNASPRKTAPRGHRRPGPPARRPLHRRHDRGDAQQAGPHHRDRNVVHRR